MYLHALLDNNFPCCIPILTRCRLCYCCVAVIRSLVYQVRFGIFTGNGSATYARDRVKTKKITILPGCILYLKDPTISWPCYLYKWKYNIWKDCHYIGQATAIYQSMVNASHGGGVTLSAVYHYLTRLKQHGLSFIMMNIQSMLFAAGDFRSNQYKTCVFMLGIEWWRIYCPHHSHHSVYKAYDKWLTLSSGNVDVLPFSSVASRNPFYWCR